MATYTIELRRICDIYTRPIVEEWFMSYDISHYLRPDQIESINQAGLWTKERLAKKIVDHYFMREIGFETPALFKHFAKITMEEIMERKLPLIYSSSIKYDPLVNVDYTENFNREAQGEAKTTGNSSSNSNSNSSGLNVSSDTPQRSN